MEFTLQITFNMLTCFDVVLLIVFLVWSATCRMINVSVVFLFIPLWILSISQIYQLFVKFWSRNPPFLRKNNAFNDAMRGVLVSRLNDDPLLLHINQSLDRKRDTFDDNERLNYNALICSIISPSHVVIDHNLLFESKFGGLTYFHKHKEWKSLYQFVSTQFQLSLKPNV
eukprot:970650_1